METWLEKEHVEMIATNMRDFFARIEEYNRDHRGEGEAYQEGETFTQFCQNNPNGQIARKYMEAMERLRIQEGRIAFWFGFLSAFHGGEEEELNHIDMRKIREKNVYYQVFQNEWKETINEVEKLAEEEKKIIYEESKAMWEAMRADVTFMYEQGKGFFTCSKLAFNPFYVTFRPEKENKKRYKRFVKDYTGRGKTGNKALKKERESETICKELARYISTLRDTKK